MCLAHVEESRKSLIPPIIDLQSFGSHLGLWFFLQENERVRSRHQYMRAHTVIFSQIRFTVKWFKYHMHAIKTRRVIVYLAQIDFLWVCGVL